MDAVDFRISEAESAINACLNTDLSDPVDVRVNDRYLRIAQTRAILALAEAVRGLQQQPTQTPTQAF